MTLVLSMVVRRALFPVCMLFCTVSDESWKGSLGLLGSAQSPEAWDRDGICSESS